MDTLHSRTTVQVLIVMLEMFFMYIVEANVSRWEKTVSETDEALKSKQQKESDTKKDVELLVEQTEEIKAEISSFKRQVEKKVGTSIN